jgi:hypothetical protein
MNSPKKQLVLDVLPEAVERIFGVRQEPTNWSAGILVFKIFCCGSDFIELSTEILSLPLHSPKPVERRDR